MRSGQRAGVFLGGVRVLVSGVLCVFMVEQPMVAAAATKRAVVPSVQQIESDQRALHALNRFTFGPRPGDVAAVREIGVKAWFERQLNPQSIDDSALEERLAAFPAMQMEQAELMQRYPSPAVLRQMIAKGEPLPGDPVEHAIYADQIAFYKAAKAKKEAEQAAAGKSGEDGTGAAGDGAMMKSAEEMKGSAALPGDGVDPATPAMATHEEQFYSGLDAVRVINLPPDERMQRILAMPPEELVRFRKSLSRSEPAGGGGGSFSDAAGDAGCAAGFAADDWRGAVAVANAARYLQRAAVGGGDDRLLAESLQRVHQEESE
ncbi:DUF1800 family protein [Tunturiibacter empetritectus]|uniref:DUF1800 family protein n=1 Tax=Tunturiibacter empetritectus TaxID=3069691 RepID=UPI003D9B6BEE